MNDQDRPDRFSRRDLIKLGLGFSIPFLHSRNFDSDSLTNKLSSDRLKRPSTGLGTAVGVEGRTIPSSGEIIPIVGLGTWRTFDAGTSGTKRSPLMEVLKTLKQKGGKVVDSSPMYGSSETVVGDLSTQLGIRSDLFFATKVWTTGEQDGIKQMNESFSKMKTDKMDLLQVHNLVDVRTHLRTLKDWKEKGKIKYIGITHYLPSAYPDMIRLIKAEKLDFIQCCYNVKTRDAEKELLPLAKEKGVAVIINRPFEEGNLFYEVDNHALPPWAKDYEINSWAQFFLKFVLSHPAVICAIPGTSNPAHMAENLESASAKLPDEMGREKMAEYFESL